MVRDPEVVFVVADNIHLITLDKAEADQRADELRETGRVIDFLAILVNAGIRVPAGSTREDRVRGKNQPSKR